MKKIPSSLVMAAALALSACTSLAVSLPSESDQEATIVAATVRGLPWRESQDRSTRCVIDSFTFIP